MKTKKIPMRRCVGCMESKPKNEMIRIAGYEGEVSIDLTGKAKGRGIYLCPDKECFQKAQKRRAIGRSLEMDIAPEQLEKLFEELKKYEKQN
ncbi:YlxR family protein [Clostridium aminobutyricum]|uniref:YlxR family protein n=1 Tax=Clostridium aminobutyricum TaxID=33953 RepID=A0A939D6R4_CLOAM|nr:YlxR family protein [Clostridium aminobutyricum]MBN7772140.1 YlxR family protein [Clostridium aminobutyricum]